MKIPVIKQLVETYSLEALQHAEEDLVEERVPVIDIGGEDDGEKLTHIFAAIYIQKKMNDDGADFKTALRDYTRKVRTSMS